MSKIALLGIDLAKYSFQLHGIDDRGTVRAKTKLYRSDLIGFVRKLEPCVIAMEACSSSHFWGREFVKLGHTVKLIPPQYVKPYVKTNKHDAADAEAIVEAVSRPSMRFVAVKSVEQQDMLALHKTRERLVKAKTALLNALRGLLNEHGVIVPRGVGWLHRSLSQTREKCGQLLSPVMLSLFERILAAEYRQLENEIGAYDKLLEQYARNHPVAKRLMKTPGVGVMAATAAIAIAGDPAQFRNGRHFAAYLGLVPRQHSTGGKERLLGISKRGNPYLRRILVSGAQSVLRWSRNGSSNLNAWVRQLLARKTWNLTATALANKNARVIWHLLAHDDEYKSQRLAA